MAWSDPKTWTADDLLTASDLNQYVSDNLSALYALVQGGGRKNLLHNGAMQVAQRGTAAVGPTATAGYKTADRWNIETDGALGTWTYSVESDAPTGSGFRKSFKVLCSSATAAPTAAQRLAVEQIIEGQNLQSVKKGTASAELLTLSFWTKSNKTGTYVVWLYDFDNNRHVAGTYTVASSGTWEQQTLTFPADLTGAFDNDNASSLTLRWGLVAGSDRASGTLATTWASYTAANSFVGQTNLASDTNNYWMITGVQLEVGSAATGFEHKSFGAELAECQRYYYRHATGDGQSISMAFYEGASVLSGQIHLPVTMRTTPVLDAASGTNYYVGVYGTDTFNSLTLAAATPTVVGYFNDSEVSGTAGGATTTRTYNASAYVGFSADL